MAGKAVVLLSGGLDSATTLAAAQREGFACHTLSLYYGQRHSAELEASKTIARRFKVVEHKQMPIDISAFGGSALTDPALEMPQAPGAGIPDTYVPARNTIFLSLALAWAEVLGASDIFIGVNAVDYSGYPDCRPEFISAFENLCALATRAGVEKDASFRIHSPLIELSKAQIIQLGHSLGVDFSLTVSCYAADKKGLACGQCESCRLRARGFLEAGVPDPTHYATNP